MIKSLYYNQEEILVAIRDLHCGGKFDADCTYGNGAFYKNIERPKLCYDLEPLADFVTKADCTNLPLLNNSLESIVCDLPFLTYIRQNRAGNGNMVMSRRFSGYWTQEELFNHYNLTIKECSRVLDKNGVLVFKTQDIINNHKMFPTHIYSHNMAINHGFRLLDLFILAASHRMPSPNRKGIQKHARIFHSYFLVFKKL